jgi:hypothetical protein
MESLYTATIVLFQLYPEAIPKLFGIELGIDENFFNRGRS